MSRSGAKFSAENSLLINRGFVKQQANNILSLFNHISSYVEYEDNLLKVDKKDIPITVYADLIKFADQFVNDIEDVVKEIDIFYEHLERSGHMFNQTNRLSDLIKDGQIIDVGQQLKEPQAIKILQGLGADEDLISGVLLEKFSTSKISLVKAGGIPGLLIDSKLLGQNTNQIIFRGLIPDGKMISKEEVSQDVRKFVDKIFGKEYEIDIQIVQPSDEFNSANHFTSDVITFARKHASRIKKIGLGHTVGSGGWPWWIIAIFVVVVVLCILTIWIPFAGWVCILSITVSG